MKAYTAQEWQIKFKEQAGKDKQLLHDLYCTGLVKEEEAQNLEEKCQEYCNLVVALLHEAKEYEDKMEKQITKFKKIAGHVQEHCCDDCEDTTMCEFGYAITELKLSLEIPRKEENSNMEIFREKGKENTSPCT